MAKLFYDIIKNKFYKSILISLIFTTFLLIIYLFIQEILFFKITTPPDPIIDPFSSILGSFFHNSIDHVLYNSIIMFFVSIPFFHLFNLRNGLIIIILIGYFSILMQYLVVIILNEIFKRYFLNLSSGFVLAGSGASAFIAGIVTFILLFFISFLVISKQKRDLLYFFG